MKFDTRYVLAFLSLVLTLWLLWYFNQLVAYIVVAWVVSMIGAPIFRFFNRWINRSASAALTLLSFTIILSLLFSMVVPPFISQARQLTNIDYNRVLSSLEEPLSDVENWMIKKGLKDTKHENVDFENNYGMSQNQPFVESIELDSLLNNGDSTGITLLININNPNEHGMVQVEEQDDDFIDQIRKSVISMFDPSRISQFFGSAFGFLSNTFIAILSIFFISYFFLKEQGLFLRMVSAIIPDNFESNASHALEESSALLIRYFIGILTQVTVITLVLSVILGIMHVKSALMIAFFAAIMNVIPYIGPIFGLTAAAFITISSNVDLPFYDGILPILIKVFIVLGIVQLLDNFILQPTIFSKSVKAHPLEIFLIVLVGAQLGGVMGMILAIPAYTVIRVLAKVFFSEYKLVQRITHDI